MLEALSAAKIALEYAANGTPLPTAVANEWLAEIVAVRENWSKVERTMEFVD